MSTREQQRVGYWLTPAGCVAAGGHTAQPGANTCSTCGASVPESPADMLERAVERIERGHDSQRLVDVAIAHRDKWARLAEEWDSHGEAAPLVMDGRASIYTGETYAAARDRWQGYLDLLNDHLAGVERGLG